VGWGNEGHRIICQIAFERLTMEGRAQVDAIQADPKDVEVRRLSGVPGLA
jgi:hypothetical protein